MAWTYKGAAACPLELGRYVVKSARFDRLLASTALALVLALSSHSGMAQQSQNRVVAAVPVPDTTLPPPRRLRILRRRRPGRSQVAP